MGPLTVALSGQRPLGLQLRFPFFLIGFRCNSNSPHARKTPVGETPVGEASTKSAPAKGGIPNILKVMGLLAVTMFWWLPAFLTFIAVGGLVEHDTCKGAKVTHGSRYNK